MGGGLANDVFAQGGKPLFYQHVVDGGAEIRRRVEQGAVEIEQHRGDLAHRSPSGRTKETM